MIVSTSFGDLSFTLFAVEPDWRSSVTGEFEVLGDLTAGLTSREARRPFSSTLRTRLSYSTTARGTAGRELVSFLRSYQSGTIGLPFWPGAVTWANRATVIPCKLKVVFNADWSNYDIYETEEPAGRADTDTVCPLLIGRLDNRDWTSMAPGTRELAIEFTETSAAAYALSPAAVAWTTGPAPSAAWNAAPPKLFPLACDWQQAGGSYRVNVRRQDIGFGREPAEYVYPQTNAVEQTVSESLFTAADVLKLLRWFADYAGGRAFWCPTWEEDLRLTAAVSSDTLTVEDVDGVAAGDFIAFIRDTIQATAQVATAVDDTVTLTADPGDFDADTLVSRLLLVRLARTKLAVNWLHPGAASAEFEVREVPPEYTPAADETLGSTLSLLPVRCYLYELTRTLGGTATVSRYTSFESDLTYGGNTYSAAKLQHGEIRQGLALDRDEVTITAPVAAGHPLTQLATLKLEAPLFLTIRSGTVNAGAAENTAVIFYGEVVGASVRGSVLTAKAVPGGSVFDRMFPRMRFQRTCNHALFSTGCGLLKTNWSFTATVQDPGTAGYPFEFVLENLQDRSITVPEGFFAGGWIESGTGATWQRRAVLLSTAPSGAVLTVTLDRDPEPFWEADDAVTLYPGCDGTPARCRFFDNWLNFGGHPFLPLANPSAVKQSSGVSGGKK